MYLAITQPTSDWLLARTGLLDALYQHVVVDPIGAIGLLSGSEFAAGALRISGSNDRRLIGVWNTDYLSGTGEESWGFIRIAGPLSIRQHPNIGREVLERSIYVINQRLQGFLIDGAFIHRSWANGTHTCLSGRGSDARQFSIGYAEERLSQGIQTPNAIIVVGPEYNFNTLSDDAKEASMSLETLYATANGFLVPTRTTRILSSDKLCDLRQTVDGYGKVQVVGAYDGVQATASQERIRAVEVSRVVGYSYYDWMAPDSPLSSSQRRVLESRALERHPLRILGPAGSGKTILMQLLALQVLESAAAAGRGMKVLYLVHSAAMVKLVSERFEVLDPSGGIREKGQLSVQTLSEYAINQIGIAIGDIVDQEAQGAKSFQLEEVANSLRTVLQRRGAGLGEDSVFRNALESEELFAVLTRLVAAEISVSIKGHGLDSDRRRYVQSERRLSRLHGALGAADRDTLFDVFEEYKARVFDGYSVLDSDDVALSLLGQLRTPVWELRRKDSGFDHIFVDETQMFNENERRLFPLLSNGKVSHVPIALALDEAQDPHGMVASGMAALGIPGATSESLSSIHRSTAEIIALAFFLIQQTTDLFGVDFPDFTATAAVDEARQPEVSQKPRIETANTERLGKSVLKRIRELRSKNVWRIAIVCFAESYFDVLKAELAGEGRDLPRFDLLRRGERLPIDAPVVVLTKPEFVGGQEFDAVIMVGLEQGVVPPRIAGNTILGAAVEQQLLRELYVAVSRAREHLVVVLSKGSLPTPVLSRAVSAGLIEYVPVGQGQLPV
jgi:superfamily I DNA/RNA helicase